MAVVGDAVRSFISRRISAPPRRRCIGVANVEFSPLSAPVMKHLVSDTSADAKHRSAYRRRTITYANNGTQYFNNNKNYIMEYKYLEEASCVVLLRAT